MAPPRSHPSRVPMLLLRYVLLIAGYLYAQLFPSAPTMAHAPCTTQAMRNYDVASLNGCSDRSLSAKQSILELVMKTWTTPT